MRIEYRLTNSGRLYNSAGMMGLNDSGIYCIYYLNNYYIGTSNDLRRRFNNRIKVLRELGIENTIGFNAMVYWGHVTFQSGGGGIVLTSTPNSYADNSTTYFNGMTIDPEILLIIASQHLPFGNITNQDHRFDHFTNIGNPMTIAITFDGLFFHQIHMITGQQI